MRLIAFLLLAFLFVPFAQAEDGALGDDRSIERATNPDVELKPVGHECPDMSGERKAMLHSRNKRGDNLQVFAVYRPHASGENAIEPATLSIHVKLKADADYKKLLSANFDTLDADLAKIADVKKRESVRQLIDKHRGQVDAMVVEDCAPLKPV